MKSKTQKSKSVEKKELMMSEREVKVFLEKELLRNDRADSKLERQHLEIQKSCRLRFFNGNPWRWEVGFKLYQGEVEYYKALIFISYQHNPIILGIIKLRNEFTGEEAMDLMYIEPPEIIAKRRWAGYGPESDYVESALDESAEEEHEVKPK